MKLKILALVAAMLMPGHALSYESYSKAGDLLEDCESRSSAADGYCQGYLASVHDAYSYFVSRGQNEKTFCMPSSVNSVQLTKVFVEYANNNPRLSTSEAFVVAVLAFNTAFPCQ